MLISVKGTLGSRVEGADEILGTVKDVLFGDDRWDVRYLVVDTGHWLPGRKVVLHPKEMDRPDWADGRIPCRRTKREIEDSPPLEEHEPVSRQYEARLSAHFLWGHIGPAGSAFVGDLAGPLGEGAAITEGETDSGGDPHLRSANEVFGYRIHATDGEIGHVEDLILDDSGEWRVRYLVVDTHNWLPGRKVLVGTGWSRNIVWGPRQVEVDLTRELIEKSPEYRPGEPINRVYEKRLYDYYGRPVYWED